MRSTRREIFQRSAMAAASWTAAPRQGPAAQGRAELARKLDRAWSEPVLKTEPFSQPVKIASAELLRNGNHFLVRARSSDGAEGIMVANNEVLRTTYPILLQRILPVFPGKDARGLESLIREAYLHNSNYKWQGLPFWVSLACIEIAILDLLGKVAGKPLGEILGGVVRRRISVYYASGNRGNAPEAEIEHLRKLVEEAGARAIKFRLGARMQYDEKSTRRDELLIPLTRKAFGPEMTIYADGNGSYDVPMAIRIGRIMEAHGLAFFEEPAPFDYYEETKKIADALKIPIAGGEEEASLRQFRWMIENDVIQVAQPDLLYFGGMIRSIRVARMAAAAGMPCTPHLSGGGLGHVYVAHFASCIPNAGAFHEYKGFDKSLPVTSDTSALRSREGAVTVPSGPGLGVTLDPDFLKKAAVVTAG